MSHLLATGNDRRRQEEYSGGVHWQNPDDRRTARSPGHGKSKKKHKKNERSKREEDYPEGVPWQNPNEQEVDRRVAQRLDNGKSKKRHKKNDHKRHEDYPERVSWQNPNEQEVDSRVSQRLRHGKSKKKRKKDPGNQRRRHSADEAHDGGARSQDPRPQTRVPDSRDEEDSVDGNQGAETGPSGLVSSGAVSHAINDRASQAPVAATVPVTQSEGMSSDANYRQCTSLPSLVATEVVSTTQDVDESVRREVHDEVWHGLEAATVLRREEDKPTFFTWQRVLFGAILLLLLLGIAIGVAVPVSRRDTNDPTSSNATSTSMGSLSSTPSFQPSLAPTSTPTMSAHPTTTPMPTSFWFQSGETINGEIESGKFGLSVAASSNGSIVAVGAPRYETASGNKIGRVQIFQKEVGGEQFVQLGQDLFGDTGGDWFGISVRLSLDGRTVVVGADQSLSGGPGYVRVFNFISNESSWVKLGNDMVGNVVGDWFGISVDISANGTIVAAGAPEHKTDEAKGQASVYQYVEQKWVQVGQQLNYLREVRFGHSVALSADGDVLIVGAGSGTQGSGAEADIGGIVHAYRLEAGSWTNMGQPIIAERLGERFGFSASASWDGMTFAVGDPENGANGKGAGNVEVFRFNGSHWIQLGSDIDGNYGSAFGISVHLSADGTMLAAGGCYESSFSESNAGVVRIFDFDGGEWQQLGSDILGESSEEYFGRSVALSADGSVVAAGGLQGNGVGPGYVKVFRTVQA